MTRTSRPAHRVLVLASTLLAAACTSSERASSRPPRPADAAPAARSEPGEEDPSNGVVVEGWVSDHRGAPVAGALVAGFESSPDAGWTSYPPIPGAPPDVVRWVRLETTATDRAGRFRLRLPAGSTQATIAARKDGVGEATKEIDVSDAANGSLKLGLVPDASVRGVLRRPDGAPAADALISYRTRPSDHPLGAFHVERRTDEHGAFHFENVPAGGGRLDTTSPDFGLEISNRTFIVPAAPGFLAEEDAILHLASGELRALDLQVKPYADVHGRAVLPDGAPAYGALVTATETGTSGASGADLASFPPPEDPLTQTFSDGGDAFNFPTLRPGRRYRIFAAYDPTLMKEDLAPDEREALKTRLLERVQPGARFASAETRPAAGENPPFTLHLK